MFDSKSAIPYVAPFGAFLALLALDKALGWPPQVFYPIRSFAVLAVILIFSRKVLSLRVSHPFSSFALGFAVFLIWIGPDVLWPGYRTHWLFSNSLTGSPASSLPEAARSDVMFLVFRFAGAALLVPVLEELFWRSFLMRWLVKPEFWDVPMGTFKASAFWMVALLFASEHGPYWEVGLAAGILYNWWMIRTRSLGDCILAHAVTNAWLSAHTIGAKQWQYWS